MFDSWKNFPQCRSKALRSPPKVFHESFTRADAKKSVSERNRERKLSDEPVRVFSICRIDKILCNIEKSSDNFRAFSTNLYAHFSLRGFFSKKSCFGEYVDKFVTKQIGL